jgi:YfiH family protein
MQPAYILAVAGDRLLAAEMRWRETFLIGTAWRAWRPYLCRSFTAEIDERSSQKSLWVTGESGRSLNEMQIIRVPGWERFTWLRHGFSTRLGGLSTVYGGHDLNLGFTRDDDRAAVEGNRARFVEAVAGEPAARLVALRQVHGTRVEVAHAGEPAEADGLMTAEPWLMLGIQAADCVPVLVADTRLRVVAGFHAGWRGTASGIVAKGVAAMAEQYGCLAEDMIGAVGPSIGVCCYEVGDEVREAFDDDDSLFHGGNVDLWEANRRHLVAAGVPRGQVTVVGECTACARVAGRRKFFSHRAEAGFTGRGMGMVGILKF